MEPGNQDYVIVENEAEKVAKEASAALKRSRTLCLPATSGVPSWTGQHGGTKRYEIMSFKVHSIIVCFLVSVYCLTCVSIGDFGMQVSINSFPCSFNHVLMSTLVLTLNEVYEL